MPRFTLLWTDALIWLLVLISLLFAWQALRHEHLRAPWRRVAHSRTALGALVVLGAYVLIGLADSVHFHPRLENATGAQVYSSRIVSLLDLIAGPLHERHETTYSAPLATHAYVKETIDLPDGRSVRDYPRLVYGGAHLVDPERDWLGDVLRTSLTGAASGAAAWLAVVAGLAFVGGATNPGVGVPMVMLSGRLAAQRIEQYAVATRTVRW